MTSYKEHLFMGISKCGLNQPVLGLNTYKLDPIIYIAMLLKM